MTANQEYKKVIAKLTDVEDLRALLYVTLDADDKRKEEVEDLTIKLAIRDAMVGCKEQQLENVKRENRLRKKAMKIYEKRVRELENQLEEYILNS